MKFVLVLVAIVAVCSAEFNTEYDDLWTMYRAKFNKVYKFGEENIRRQNWESTLAYILRHNLEESIGLHTYTLGINQFSDWSRTEYLAYLTRKPSNGSLDWAPVFDERSVAGPIPNDIDWRTQGLVTGIKDQGQCGSCWAFSSTGSLEGQLKKKTGVLQSYSEQQLVDCSRATYGNQGCNGGLESGAFRYVRDITNQGRFLDLESCYTYRAKDGTCNPNYAATCKGATATGYTSIARGSETGLATALSTVGPISVAIDASHPSFQSYRSGIYNEPRCSTTNLDHAVLAVGYAADYYIVKNSWGTSWGTAGYIQMARNRNNQCGIATEALYPNV